MCPNWIIVLQEMVSFESNIWYTRSEYIQSRYSYLYLFSIICKSEKHKKITTHVVKSQRKTTKSQFVLLEKLNLLISKNWRADTTKRVQRLVRFHATFEAITVLTIPRRNGEFRVKTAGSGISIGRFLCGTFPRFVKWPTQIFPSGNAKHFRAENRANEIPPESSYSLSLARDANRTKATDEMEFSFQSATSLHLRPLFASLTLCFVAFVRAFQFLSDVLFSGKGPLFYFDSHTRLRTYSAYPPGHATRGLRDLTLILCLSVCLSVSLSLSLFLPPPSLSLSHCNESNGRHRTTPFNAEKVTHKATRNG